MNEVDDGALRYGIPDGAEVAAVLDGSCADQAGLQAGDIITAVGDTTVESRSELQTAVQAYRAGDTVTFTVYRDGTSMSVQVTLDEYDQERADAMDALNEEYQASQEQTQQSTSNGNSGYGFGFNWPFNW